MFWTSQSCSILKVTSFMQSWLWIQISLLQFNKSSTYSWLVYSRFEDSRSCRRLYIVARSSATGTRLSISSLEDCVSSLELSIVVDLYCNADFWSYSEIFTSSLGSLGSLGAPFFLNLGPDQLYVSYIQKRNGVFKLHCVFRLQGLKRNGIILGVL